MRKQVGMAVVLASTLVSSMALAQAEERDDWESPVALTAQDDWEAPVAAMYEWEAPVAAMDDWEAPGTVTVNWESPVALTRTQSCLRSAHMSWQPEGTVAPVLVLGFWDVCSDRWQSYQVVDATWMSSYSTLAAGRAIYRARTYQDATGWHGLLFNFRLNRWEEQPTAGQ